MTKKDDVFHFEETAAPLLRRYARGLCAGCGAAEADELVQTALDRIAPSLRELDARAPEAAQAKIAAYRALTDLAREKLRGPAPRPSPRHAPIVDGLAELPFDERAALLLVALEGLTYEDAANVCAGARETIVARLMRARAALSGLDLRPANGPRRAGGHLRIVK